jgi:hypothetical protein
MGLAVPWGVILVGSISSLSIAHDRPSYTEVWSEEVLPSEKIGAKQLVLRSFMVERSPNGDGAQVTVSIKLPPPAGAKRIALEVVDRRDKGYSLRAAIQCSSAGVCSRSWATGTLRKTGLTTHDLWLAARSVDTMNADEALMPACFCKASDLNGRVPVLLSLMPSRALNIRYSIFNDFGVLLETRLITNQPAGLPVVIRVTPNPG